MSCFKDGRVGGAFCPAIAVALMVSLVACGTGGAQQTTPPPSPTVSIAVQPNSASLSVGASQTFIATVSGTANTGVTWSASAGSVSGTGNTVTYTAPANPGSYTLSATSAADATKSATSTILVSAAPTVSIAVQPNSASLSVGSSQTFVATVSGTANTGVTWSASAGLVSGTGNTVTYTAPANPGSYTLSATSAADATKSATSTILVSAPSGAAAVMVTPVSGATFTGASTTFVWSAGTNVSQYSLSLGSSPGANDLLSANPSTSTTATVSGLPQDGRAIYAQLGSLITGSWIYNQYIYTAASSNTASCGGMALGQQASLNGFRPFPDNNPWNQDISAAAVDGNSDAIIGYIGAGVGLHADFGSGTFAGASLGIPYVVVDSTQANVNVLVTQYASESDVMPMPIPSNAPIEGFPNLGDNHVLVLDKSNCFLYEFFQGLFSSGQWSATASAVWDLQNYNSRPYTWTSVDAAGLPVFPGLVRYDEVAAGSVKHAIRFTLPHTKAAFVSPATHWAGNSGTSPIPMGMRVRLKASFDVSSLSAANQAILNAMKKYGLLLADNGSAMFISGTPDSRWDNNDLHQLGAVTASNFEVIQMPTVITSSNVPSGAPPTISNLSPSATTVTAGAAVTLSWQASGASYYFLSPEVGPVRGNSVVVNPSLTTTYTLTATNAFGRNSATVTIQVH